MKVLLGWVVKLALLGFLVLGFVFAYAIYSQKQRCIEIEKKEKEFPIHLLELSNFHSHQSVSEISGRLTNRSPYPIYGFSVLVKGADCGSKECVKLGETFFGVEIDVPAGEARDFHVRSTGNPFLRGSNPLSNARPKGVFRLTGQVTSATVVNDLRAGECSAVIEG